MSAITPEQMRETARELEGPHWAGAADTRAAAVLHTAADEVDRLRAVVEDAPHTRGCILRTRRYGGTCDCWKADAL